ncbi:lipoprotein-releasing ABC transporter permease subunit LolE [Gallibacterium salpingitidis]|uniref:Outer membrane-specific lipoprotein transporter subunit LolE n=1 Tax=Gallibacterium salpingitidis TaxID=505341 RepID=A0A1A7NQY6_9PAST|nr:lipoprotein-releasing ABC transporter permease subunit LolE [Gallibacterium salpingitidis]OBW91424.1 outer membrane-specific lipoprotein transporter subunit LolE [Gallibacterium salpingitidis]
MSTPFFISWRYQRGKQKNRLVSLIAWFSTIGIALGVAVLIIGLSAMNGFQRELDQRILAVVPHIDITGYERQPIEDWHQLQQALANHSQIKGISPYVAFTSLAESGSKLKVIQVKGVDPTLLQKVSAVGQFVLQQGWQKFAAEKQGIILGYGIAKDLDVKEGDWVSLLVSNQNQQDISKMAQPERHRLQVMGILRLDGQLDHSYAFIPLSVAQQYLNYNENQVTGVELAIKSPFAVNSFDYSALATYPQGLIANTWIDSFGYMYRDISLIKTIMYLAMVLVIGIACFNIISTLIMAVKDKQDDIAILRTLGADSRFIRHIFLWYGLFSGMKGCLWGIVLGILVALNLTEIIYIIEKILHTKILSDGVYFIDFMPSELHVTDVALVFFATLILSLVASLYPAIRAARLQPAKVLNNH